MPETARCPAGTAPAGIPAEVTAAYATAVVAEEAGLIALGTVALLEHPEQLELLRAHVDDQKLVASAVEELLRYLTIAIPRSSPTPTASTSGGTPAATCPSGSGCTSASASRWPPTWTNSRSKHDGFVYGLYELPVTW